MQRAPYLQTCILCRRALSVSSRNRATAPAPRPKIRSMPRPGEKPALPVVPEQHSSPFQHAQAAAQQAQTDQAKLSYVREEDVMQRVYAFRPPSSPVVYYLGTVFLFFFGVNIADAWRLDSLGTLSRPLLPTEEKRAQSVDPRGQYSLGAFYILAGTTVSCALLAYLPTRHISSVTIVPRFPRPASDQHRIAWYHHSDAILHSTADFIALPLAAFRKGRRVPFASLRLIQPLTSRPSPSASVGGQSVTASQSTKKRAGTIRVATDAVDFPLTHYYLTRPDAPGASVECDDVLVFEKALQFNAEVERTQKIKQKR